MKRIWLRPSTIVKIAFLLTSVQVATQPSMAKKTASAGPPEFLIMLNGSWSYVQDPTPAKDPNTGADTQHRIVLVAPSHHSHNAFIYAGPDATSVPMGTRPLDHALYYIDIPNRTNPGTLQPGDPKPQAYVGAQGQVSNATIQHVIYTYDSKNPRYAISVPTPDYYTTFVSSSNVPGTAESKIDTGDVGSVTPASDYTIWMVLHYQVTASVPSLNEGILGDDGSIQSNLPLQASANAVSIVNKAADSLSQKDCDTYSIYSFDHMRDLWGLPLNARFPEETVGAIGGQIHGYYHYECPLQAEEQTLAAKQKAFEKAVRCSRITLNQINSVRKTFGLISKGTPLEQSGEGERDCGDVEKSPIDNIAHINQAITDLSLGIVSKGMRKDLACLQELTSKDPKKEDCLRDLLREDLAEYVLQNDQNAVYFYAMGSTDCHAAQMTIDVTIPGNVYTSDASPKK